MPPPAASCDSDFIKAPLTIRYSGRDLKPAPLLPPLLASLRSRSPPLVKITRTREIRRSCLSFLFTRKRAYICEMARGKEKRKEKKRKSLLPFTTSHLRVFTINRCFSKSRDVGYRSIAILGDRASSVIITSVGTIIGIVVYTCIDQRWSVRDAHRVPATTAQSWQLN